MIISAELQNQCVFPSANHGKSLNQLHADHFQGKIYQTFASHGNDSYKYSIGICTDVKGDRNANRCAYQEKINSTLTWTTGSCAFADVHSGSDWILLIYENGDRYDHACNKTTRRTMIMINCNCSVEDGVLKFYEEEYERLDGSCYYMFELDTKHICPGNCEETSILKSDLEINSKHLSLESNRVQRNNMSVGSILLIWLVPSIFLII